MVLQENFKPTIFKDEEERYTNLRKNIEGRFDKRNEEAGEPSREQAEGVGEDELTFMNTILFNKKYCSSMLRCCKNFGDRLLLNWDRVLVGRISEISVIKYKQIRFGSRHNCIMVSS